MVLAFDVVVFIIFLIAPERNIALIVRIAAEMTNGDEVNNSQNGIDQGIHNRSDRFLMFISRFFKVEN